MIRLCGEVGGLGERETENQIILGLKDMAGVCPPRFISALVQALRKRWPALVLHYHRHATDGLFVPAVGAAAAAGAHIVDVNLGASARAYGQGDALATARVAGILAAKRTAELIPLCHPVRLTFADVRFSVRDVPPGVLVEAETRAADRTGVEMEALVAAQTAAAVIYDMCKAVQRDITIRDARLVYKSGGRSGVFDRRSE